MQVSIDQLLMTIGRQTVELDLLRKQVEQLLASNEAPNGVADMPEVDILEQVPDEV